MPQLNHRLGFTLGTFARKFLRAIKNHMMSAASRHSSNAAVSLPGPCLSDQMISDLSQVPAIVRSKGVDLRHWYEVNTRPVNRPMGCTAMPAMGSLADLI